MFLRNTLADHLVRQLAIPDFEEVKSPYGLDASS